MLGAVGLTVKNCRFENVGFGVWTEYAGSSDFYIADNLFLGRDDRFRLIGWTGPLWASAGPYGSHQLTSYYAIKVYGPGHVIAHNAIAYFHDGIGISTYGTPEQDPERRASSIDIYNNDMHMLERRLRRDRRRRAQHPRHEQPRRQRRARRLQRAAGVRRAGVLHRQHARITCRAAWRSSSRPSPPGLFVYHNTIIGEQTARDPSSNMHFRNNLFLGRDTPEPRHHDLGERDRRVQLRLQRLPPEQRRRRAVRVAGSRSRASGCTSREPEDWKSFATLAELRAATGKETHGVEVDFDIFERMTPPDPAKRHAVYHAMDLNFALKPGSKAVDAGVMIPTVNDGFAGRAPDLGALEVGKPAPKYGPRWLDWQPFYRLKPHAPAPKKRTNVCVGAQGSSSRSARKRAGC